MLAIRLSRTGKKHQPFFRIIVSDKRKAPTAKFVEILGNYDPHSKKLTVDKEKLELYMKNGACPSNTLAKLLKTEKVGLPKWVNIIEKKKAPKKKEPASPQASQGGEKPEAKEKEKGKPSTDSAHSTNTQGGEQSRTTSSPQADVQDADESTEKPKPEAADPEVEAEVPAETAAEEPKKESKNEGEELASNEAEKPEAKDEKVENNSSPSAGAQDVTDAPEKVEPEEKK